MPVDFSHVADAVIDQFKAGGVSTTVRVIVRTSASGLGGVDFATMRPVVTEAFTDAPAIKTAVRRGPRQGGEETDAVDFIFKTADLDDFVRVPKPGDVVVEFAGTAVEKRYGVVGCDVECKNLLLRVHCVQERGGRK